MNQQKNTISKRLAFLLTAQKIKYIPINKNQNRVQM